MESVVMENHDDSEELAESAILTLMGLAEEGISSELPSGQDVGNRNDVKEDEDGRGRETSNGEHDYLDNNTFSAAQVGEQIQLLEASLKDVESVSVDYQHYKDCGHLVSKPGAQPGRPLSHSEWQSSRDINQQNHTLDNFYNPTIDQGESNDFLGTQSYENILETHWNYDCLEESVSQNEKEDFNTVNDHHHAANFAKNTDNYTNIVANRADYSIYDSHLAHVETSGQQRILNNKQQILNENAKNRKPNYCNKINADSSGNSHVTPPCNQFDTLERDRKDGYQTSLTQNSSLDEYDPKTEKDDMETSTIGNITERTGEMDKGDQAENDLDLEESAILTLLYMSQNDDEESGEGNSNASDTQGESDDDARNSEKENYKSRNDNLEESQDSQEMPKLININEQISTSEFSNYESGDDLDPPILSDFESAEPHKHQENPSGAIEPEDLEAFLDSQQTLAHIVQGKSPFKKKRGRTPSIMNVIKMAKGKSPNKKSGKMPSPLKIKKMKDNAIGDKIFGIPALTCMKVGKDGEVVVKKRRGRPPSLLTLMKRALPKRKRGRPPKLKPNITETNSVENSLKKLELITQEPTPSLIKQFSPVTGSNNKPVNDLAQCDTKCISESKITGLDFKGNENLVKDKNQLDTNQTNLHDDLPLTNSSNDISDCKVKVEESDIELVPLTSHTPKLEKVKPDPAINNPAKNSPFTPTAFQNSFLNFITSPEGSKAVKRGCLPAPVTEAEQEDMEEGEKHRVKKHRKPKEIKNRNKMLSKSYLYEEEPHNLGEFDEKKALRLHGIDKELSISLTSVSCEELLQKFSKNLSNKQAVEKDSIKASCSQETQNDKTSDTDLSLPIKAEETDLKEKDLKEKDLKEKDFKENELKENELKENDLKEKDVKENDLKEKDLKEKDLKEIENKSIENQTSLNEEECVVNETQAADKIQWFESDTDSLCEAKSETSDMHTLTYVESDQTSQTLSHVGSDSNDTIISSSYNKQNNTKVSEKRGVTRELKVLVRRMSQDLIDSYTQGDLHEKLVVIPDTKQENDDTKIEHPSTKKNSRTEEVKLEHPTINHSTQTQPKDVVESKSVLEQKKPANEIKISINIKSGVISSCRAENTENSQSVTSAMNLLVASAMKTQEKNIDENSEHKPTVQDLSNIEPCTSKSQGKLIFSNESIKKEPKTETSPICPSSALSEGDDSDKHSPLSDDTVLPQEADVLGSNIENQPKPLHPAVQAIKRPESVDATIHQTFNEVLSCPNKKLYIKLDKLPLDLVQCQKKYVLQPWRVRGLTVDGRTCFWAMLKGKWLRGKDPPPRRVSTPDSVKSANKTDSLKRPVKASPTQPQNQKEKTKPKRRKIDHGLVDLSDSNTDSYSDKVTYPTLDVKIKEEKTNDVTVERNAREMSPQMFTVMTECKKCSEKTKVNANVPFPSFIFVEYICPKCSPQNSSTPMNPFSSNNSEKHSFDAEMRTENSVNILQLMKERAQLASKEKIAKMATTNLFDTITDGCNHCSYDPSDAKDLVAHKWFEHGESSCLTCKIKFLVPGQLSTHLRLHKLDEPSKCFLCEESVLNFYGHVYMGHQIRSCNLCGEKMSTIGEYMKHLEVVKGMKFQNGQHVCPKDECGFVIYTLDLFFKHLWDYHGERNCVLCSQKNDFITLDDLLNHLSSHANHVLEENREESNVAFWEAVQPTSIDGDDFKKVIKPPNVAQVCNLCGLKFSSQGKLTKHRWFVHASTLPDENNFYFPAQLSTSINFDHIKRCSCWECGEEFPDLSELTNHLWYKHEYHGCFICYEQCSSIDQLKAHLDRHKKTSFTKESCPYVICKKTFKDLQQLVLHMWTCHHERRCLYCDTLCVSQDHFWTHAIMHNCCEIPSSDAWVSYLTKSCMVFNQKCPLCPFLGPTIDVVYVHIYDEHGVKMCILCRDFVCYSDFKSSETQQDSQNEIEKEQPVGAQRALNMYIDHMHQHQVQGKSLICVFCGHKSPNIKQSMNHIETKHQSVSASTFRCDQCRLRFDSLISITNHLQHEHPDSTFIEGTSENQTVSNDSPCKNKDPSGTVDTTCVNSDKDMQVTQAMEMGEDTSAKVDSPSRSMTFTLPKAIESEASKEFKCSQCSRSFLCHEHLIEHLKAHTGKRPYRCAHCSSSYANPDTLRTHLETHQRTKEHKCKHCGKSFHRYDHMINHEAIHSPEKNHVCLRCGKRFATYARLQQHTIVHDNKKPYDCPFCKKSFKRNDHMQAHMQTHGGEKTHVCDYCDNKFYTAYKLQTHLLVHTKPFGCQHCEKSFSSESQALKHQEKQHNS